MFSLASCVMLFYDIAITFGDEVERIWKQRFTGATVLWFLNRYLSPLGYIVIIVSFHDPSWSKATCHRYVLYPEILKIFTATAVGLIFILRLYSIYSKSSLVLYSFSALLVIELAIKIWAFTDGVMLQLPPGFVGCILTGKSSPGDRIIYTWVAELVFGMDIYLFSSSSYCARTPLTICIWLRSPLRAILCATIVTDSAVFFATLYRTIQLYRRTIIGEALSLIAVIMRDGIMYFAAIFVSNLVTVLIFVFATNDLKVINASFSTLITSLMVSRLMLNLRGEVMKRGPVLSNHAITGHNEDESIQLSSTSFSKRDQRSTQMIGTVSGWSAFESSIVGNLGAPIMTFERDNRDYYDFNEGDEDVVDPSLPGSPRSTPAPSSPFSSHAHSPLSPLHSSSSVPPSPLSSYTPRSPSPPPNLYPPQKAARRAGSDDTHSDGPWDGIPIHADYAALRIRAVSRTGSVDSSGSAFTALSPAPRPGSASAAVRIRNQNQSPYRVRRPRTSESPNQRERERERESDRDRDRERAAKPARRRERDVGELMHTRSLPTPVIVQVTEEVVVDEVAEDALSPLAASPTSSSSPLGTGRRPQWLAPPSWRLSRDGVANQRRGSSEG
ncbi:hypothetical protein C8Q74DRAFT_1286150 [Fomes fomentarius]|nr:hypothetical protein C8Q74DRAFT_1286150 [Fomes fomentarius]